jgi:peptidoglycan/LPS O-acetylase OafA/YrhL
MPSQPLSDARPKLPRGCGWALFFVVFVVPMLLAAAIAFILQATVPRWRTPTIIVCLFVGGLLVAAARLGLHQRPTGPVRASMVLAAFVVGPIILFASAILLVPSWGRASELPAAGALLGGYGVAGIILRRRASYSTTDSASQQD